MDPIQGDTCNEHKKEAVEDTTKKDAIDDLLALGVDPKLVKQSSSTSSTSSDSSSDEDFFQLHELNKAALPKDSEPLASGTKAIESEGNGITGNSLATINSAPNLVDCDLALSAPLQEEKAPAGKQILPTMGDSVLERPVSPEIPLSSPSVDSTLVTYGSLQSPPAQTMVRNDVPDPNRIPSSIFARTKSTTPMEWSVASNESLFSIHVGNSSFSRDHVFLLGRSGELGILPSPMDYPMPMTPPSARPLSPDIGRQLEQPETAQEANAEAMKEVLRAAAEAHADKDQPQTEGTSLSRHSDGSAMSFRSFAFPMSSRGSSGSVTTRCCQCYCCEIRCQKKPFNGCAYCQGISCRGCFSGFFYFLCIGCFSNCFRCQCSKCCNGFFCRQRKGCRKECSCCPCMRCFSNCFCCQCGNYCSKCACCQCKGWFRGWFKGCSCCPCMGCFTDCVCCKCRRSCKECACCQCQGWFKGCFRGCSCCALMGSCRDCVCCHCRIICRELTCCKWKGCFRGCSCCHWKTKRCCSLCCSCLHCCSCETPLSCCSCSHLHLCCCNKMP